jgi:HEPN domain-containing protein
MPKENKISLAKLFIKKAKQDLSTSKILMENGAYGDSCYYAQQTVEKIVKAALILKTGLFPRDHLVSGYFSSELLAYIPPNWEKKLKKILIDIVELEEHWLKPKYPYVTDNYKWDPTEEYQTADAKKAYAKAENAVSIITEFIKDQYNVE